MGGALVKAKNSDINLINFSEFKSLGRFPKYPDDKDVTSDLSHIDRDKSLIIYISHAWSRINDDMICVDNEYDEKYNLCVSGIEIVKQRLASTTLECYSKS